MSTPKMMKNFTCVELKFIMTDDRNYIDSSQVLFTRVNSRRYGCRLAQTLKQAWPRRRINYAPDMTVGNAVRPTSAEQRSAFLALEVDFITGVADKLATGS